MPRFEPQAVTLFSFVLIAGALPAADNTGTLQVDWETRTAACPAKVTQPTPYTLAVTNINDVAINFKTGQRMEYQFRAKGTPVSVTPPENPFWITQAGVESKAKCEVDKAGFQAQLDSIRAAVLADARLNPPAGAGVSLAASVAAGHNIQEVGQVESEIRDSACAAVVEGFANHPVVQWINRLNGTHSVTFHVNLEPNQNYAFTLRESWEGQNTAQGKMSWNCGESDLVSLSVGPLITTLPSRTYDHQKAPVPAGSSTTQDILVVGNNSNVNALGAALLNYHLPAIPGLSGAGFAISAGPVYQLGNTSSGVSALGVFFGVSMHLYRSIYVTPGVHIGQFADFPAGFYPGTVIPDGFGNLTPIKRNTAHFAIGVTFKTNSFKKSSQAGGSATNTAASAAGNTGAADQTGQRTAQSNSGSTGKPPAAQQQEKPDGSGKPK